VQCCLFLSVALVLDSLEQSFSESLSHNLVTSILTLSSFLLGWCLCPLSVFHCYLIAANKTTNEELVGFFGDVDAREHFSFCESFRKVFCARTAATKVRICVSCMQFIGHSQGLSLSVGGFAIVNNPSMHQSSAVHVNTHQHINTHRYTSQPPRRLFPHWSVNGAHHHTERLILNTR